MKLQETLNRMRSCAQIILATIRTAEDSNISQSEFLSAQNAIDALFVLWNNHDQSFSDYLKEEVHLKLLHVFEKRAQRKDVYDQAKVEKLLNLILKEVESPRNRGLVFYIFLFLVIQEFSRLMSP
jgi:hypothetical protein